MSFQDTIIAPATAPGIGAIAVIRLSGTEAINITKQVFRGKDLTLVNSHTLHFGTIRDDDNNILDEVLVSVFKAPHSFTKENIIEISTHGSPYIVKKIIQLLIHKGARTAKAGEFTQRAFINGQFDLAQAEAVADLIASDSEIAHQTAMNQMRGGFSKNIKQLREQLIHFASMIELELDFGEEDVEFADREDLKQLIHKLLKVIIPLVQSFDLGNVIKEGIPTVIAGKPNVGKSTLLNALLNEEKAIVSDVPGTTRDYIEDEIVIEGIKFRFVDTAGLRDTDDKVEAIGVARSKEQLNKASLILYLFDAEELGDNNSLQKELDEIKTLKIPYLFIANKLDTIKEKEITKYTEDFVFISANIGTNLNKLKELILQKVGANNFKSGDTIITNIRHYEGLSHTQQSLEKVLKALNNNITGDFLAMDIRQALHHLGELTGTITTDDLLDNIFSKFCIGK